MPGNGKLNKGINGKLVQDVYRGVEDNNGNIQFNKVMMKNLCFVKFPRNNKPYIFTNQSDYRLIEGDVVVVDTSKGHQFARVVGSIKIQNKYIPSLQLALYGKKLKIKNVIAVYKE